MGREYFRRKLSTPGVVSSSASTYTGDGAVIVHGSSGNLAFDWVCPTTGTVIQYRVVKLNATGEAKLTTGAAGVRVDGVMLSTGTSTAARVRLFGKVTLQASSAAIARGAYLRATSGAVASTTFLGGTVRTTTNSTHFVLGIALTSAAAGASARYITAWFRPIGKCAVA